MPEERKPRKRSMARTPYQRIVSAADRGDGVRLTADETFALSLDVAIATRAVVDDERARERERCHAHLPRPGFGYGDPACRCRRMDGHPGPHRVSGRWEWTGANPRECLDLVTKKTVAL